MPKQGFYEFWGNFGLQDTFKERIAPKSIETDMEKLYTKLSALSVDFDSPSLDFLRSRKPAHEEWYRCKSCYFTIVDQSFVKTIANRHGHAAYHNKH